MEGLDAAIERGGRYKETGVDMVFVQGADREEVLRRVCRAIPGLHLANLSQAGQARITVGRPPVEADRRGYRRTSFWAGTAGSANAAGSTGRPARIRV